jgi:hypothetical protein
VGIISNCYSVGGCQSEVLEPFISLVSVALDGRCGKVYFLKFAWWLVTEKRFA